MFDNASRNYFLVSRFKSHYKWSSTRRLSTRDRQSRILARKAGSTSTKISSALFFVGTQLGQNGFSLKLNFDFQRKTIWLPTKNHLVPAKKIYNYNEKPFQLVTKNHFNFYRQTVKFSTSNEKQIAKKVPTKNKSQKKFQRKTMHPRYHINIDPYK